MATLYAGRLGSAVPVLRPRIPGPTFVKIVARCGHAVPCDPPEQSPDLRQYRAIADVPKRLPQYFAQFVAHDVRSCSNRSPDKLPGHGSIVVDHWGGFAPQKPGRSPSIDHATLASQGSQPRPRSAPEYRHRRPAWSPTLQIEP